MGSALTRALAAEEAMEVCLSCMGCMCPLTRPLTCTPCGHTYCEQCLATEPCAEGGGEYRTAVCPECDGPAGRVVTVGMLHTLTSKFAAQKQTLAELQLKAVATAARAVHRMAGATVASAKREPVAVG